MTPAPNPPPVLPTPSADTVEKLAQFQNEHHRRASPEQRFANHVTRVLGRPSSVAIVLTLILLWIIGNHLAPRFGIAAFEKPPFPDLEFVATIVALMVTLLILSSQRHADHLADKRAQLTLQIAYLNEKKSAKIIALLEEQRRDNPLLNSRIDSEADEMARSSDPNEALGRIEATQREP